jgi:hypothetical protein
MFNGGEGVWDSFSKHNKGGYFDDNNADSLFMHFSRETK